MDLAKLKLNALINKRRANRTAGAPAQTNDQLRRKDKMRKVDLPSMPINHSQYIVLFAVVSKFEPQKADYDGIMIFEVLPYMENPNENTKLKERLKYWSDQSGLDTRAALIGHMIPWNPRNINNEDISYRDERLQETLSSYKKEKERSVNVFNAEVKHKHRKGILENRLNADTLDQLKEYRSEELDGPITDLFKNPGDEAILREIMEDRKQVEETKKKLGKIPDVEVKALTDVSKETEASSSS